MALFGCRGRSIRLQCWDTVTHYHVKQEDVLVPQWWYADWSHLLYRWPEAGTEPEIRCSCGWIPNEQNDTEISLTQWQEHLRLVEIIRLRETIYEAQLRLQELEAHD